MMGGNLILRFDTQTTCHAECLMHAHQHVQGVDRIKVEFLRAGRILEAMIDASLNRRNVLED